MTRSAVCCRPLNETTVSEQSLYVPRWAYAERNGLAGRIKGRLRRELDRVGTSLAGAGCPPWLLREVWRRHIAAEEAATAYETVFPATVATAALPLNVGSSQELAADAGWFGFAMRDVPHRAMGPTRVLTIADARVVTGTAPGLPGDFSVAILDAEGRSLDLREIRFRPFLARAARQEPVLELDDVFWVAERVFDNYSHWFSAHLPKLLIMQRLGTLNTLVLPSPRPAWLDASLRLVGIDPSCVKSLPLGESLRARRLTLVETDRFRPEMLAAARDALSQPQPDADGSVFISRRRARGRRLRNEEVLEALLGEFGVEPVAMERLSLEEQIGLMGRTRTLIAPHGAGLSNMLFCPRGTRIIEIADAGYPNPNFYAMAAALGHDYVYVPARGVGAGHPLDRDLEIDAHALRGALEALA